jgi:hypothetical protein
MVVWMRERKHAKVDDQMLILFRMFNPRVSGFIWPTLAGYFNQIPED